MENKNIVQNVYEKKYEEDLQKVDQELVKENNELMKAIKKKIEILEEKEEIVKENIEIRREILELKKENIKIRDEECKKMRHKEILRCEETYKSNLVELSKVNQELEEEADKLIELCKEEIKKLQRNKQKIIMRYEKNHLLEEDLNNLGFLYEKNNKMLGKKITDEEKEKKKKWIEINEESYIMNKMQGRNFDNKLFKLIPEKKIKKESSESVEDRNKNLLNKKESSCLNEKNEEKLNQQKNLETKPKVKIPVLPFFYNKLPLLKDNTEEFRKLYQEEKKRIKEKNRKQIERLKKQEEMKNERLRKLQEKFKDDMDKYAGIGLKEEYECKNREKPIKKKKEMKENYVNLQEKQYKEKQYKQHISMLKQKKKIELLEAKHKISKILPEKIKEEPSENIGNRKRKLSHLKITTNEVLKKGKNEIVSDFEQQKIEKDKDALNRFIQLKNEIQEKKPKIKKNGL